MSLASVIKYEGDNSTFVWKHPCEDFTTSTQLIVHESQEAIFFLNGQALDLFGPGRHTLETQNIPLLRRLINAPTGGNTPFHCEVYFVNKAEQMALRWGTDSKIQYVERTYGFPLSIGASGEMALSVDDSRKLLVKLVGTEKALGRTQLIAYFRSILMTRAKTYLAQVMRESAISIFEVDESLERFSEDIKRKLVPDFLDYGLRLELFYVTTVVKPDGDPQYERFKDLHFRQYADIAEAKLLQQTEVIHAQTQAQKVIIDSQAQATKRAQEGYTYQQERGFDVAQDIARNEAVGQFANMGVGLGVMTGVGGTVGGVVGGAVTDAFAGMVGGSAGASVGVEAPLGVEVTSDAGAAPAAVAFGQSAQGAQFVQPQQAQQPQPQTHPQSVQQPQPQEAVGFCDQCGAQLEPGAVFCDQCGASVAACNQNTCVNCGYEFSKPGKFCPKCGARRES